VIVFRVDPTGPTAGQYGFPKLISWIDRSYSIIESPVMYASAHRHFITNIN
jgi:hypothetical protein